MKSLDLYVEKRACDRGTDNNANRAFSREVNDIAMLSASIGARASHVPARNDNLRPQRNQSGNLRDKMSFAAIAFGSPFFLMGLGATFAIVDEFNYIGRVSRLNDGADKQHRAVRPNRNMGMMEPVEKESLPAGSSAAWLMSLDLIPARAGKSKKEIQLRKDQAVFSPEKAGNAKFVVPGQNWLNASKLLKKKIFLIGQVERLNGQQQFSQIAGLIAEIGILDKALKRLGC